MLLSLKSVMNTLRAPSPPFVALTALHFRAARRRIAGRCCKLLELKANAAADAPAPATAGVAADAAAASEGGEAGKAAAGAVVAEAGLEGVLNTMPSLGFLHSLQRVLPALESALAAVGDGAAAAASDEALAAP